MEPFLFYAACAMAAAIIALGGLLANEPLTAYLVPAILQAIPAVHATLNFIVRKRGLANWAAFGGSFLFFHFQLFSPVYWDQFVIEIAPYSISAKLVSVLGSNVLPVLLVASAKIFDRFGRASTVHWPRNIENPVYQKRLLIGFVVLFAVTAVPQVLYGRVVVGAILQIVYMRAGVTTSGEGYYQAGAEAAASLFNLQHFATSLLLLGLLLRKSRYWIFVRWVMPLAAIWAAANLLGGTRTQLLLFAAALFVIFAADPLRKIQTRYAIGLPILVLILSQFASVFRNEGIVGFNAASFREGVTRIQGLETIHDQTRAVEFFVEGYRSPWNVGFAPLDAMIGLVYRPIELAMFIMPRSIFPWKPVDPTFEDLNRLAMTAYGLNPDEVIWGITAGIIGRDMLRWGELGWIVPLFWLGFLLSVADRFYREGSICLDRRIMAGAIAGSCIAMYRDLSPLWCLQMFPALLIILWAQRALPRAVAAMPKPMPRRVRVAAPRQAR